MTALGVMSHLFFVAISVYRASEQFWKLAFTGLIRTTLRSQSGIAEDHRAPRRPCFASPIKPDDGRKRVTLGAIVAARAPESNVAVPVHAS